MAQRTSVINVGRDIPKMLHALIVKEQRRIHNGSIKRILAMVKAVATAAYFGCYTINRK